MANDPVVPTRSSLFFDNTMLSSYKDCPRRYQIRHKLGWRGTGTAMPLIFGLSWHSAMDVVWAFATKADPRELALAAIGQFLETWESEGLPAKPDIEQLEALGNRNPSVAHEMLVNYIGARGPMLRSSKLIAAEQPFAVPLPGTTDVWYIGRLDKVVQYNGQTLVIEHKTTSEYKKDGGFKSLYIEGWYSDSQVKGYQFGGSMFFPDLSQVWVDAALVHKTVHDAFRFVPVAHQRPLLEEWLTDTRDWVERIRRDSERNYFPKNESACIGKFGACPFLDICRTTADPSKLDSPPSGYMEDHWEPFETLGLSKLIGDSDG
ncbi:MAG: PD-(D/E)XK nuclease family protein [Acidiferrobacteraceae bacterium]